MMTKIDSEGKEKKKLSSTYVLLVIMKNGFHHLSFISEQSHRTLTPRCTAQKCANTSPCKHKSWDETISKSLIWIAIQI